MTDKIDGRSARRARNRDVVIESALALVAEGDDDPSVERLTVKSGLSARSIFRYFDGLDDLRRAVIARNFERVSPLLQVADIGKGSLADRITRFVDTRVKVNETMSGTARTAYLRAPYVPLIAEDIARYRKLLDSTVRQHFAPELKKKSKAEGDDLVSLIDVLVSFDSWDIMTRQHRRSRSQIKRSWAAGLEALFGASKKGR